MWIDNVFYDDYEDIIDRLANGSKMMTPGILYLEHFTSFHKHLLALIADFL
jgi:hypothetical protein